MKTYLSLFFLLSYGIIEAQIVGKITSESGDPLPYVNIYLENEFIGTTSNEDGDYSLALTEAGNYRINFQFLGYKTLTKNIEVVTFPYVLDVELFLEQVSLEEVIINSTEDPAYRVIRNTIENREATLAKLNAYTSDFYSRGIWRVKDVPEKILGQDIGDFDGALDSTRSGIIYLSETISKIAYSAPDDFQETILASKVSGNDNGFSFNSAQDANFSFYENTIDLNTAIVSPIAKNALNYYNYKLDGVFYEGSKLINKISVIPKRQNDRIWTGTIYIVEDDWQLYGAELKTTGLAIQLPFIKELIFTQNFKYDTEIETWVKISQNIDFSFGLFGFSGNGKFIAVYSNYEFKPTFKKNYFTNQVLSFKTAANKKDSIFWEESRPVPLTNEEVQDYVKKDSIQILRKSKNYLDSIDSLKNRLEILDPLTGYSYQNSYEKWSITYKGPLPGINFNTVQGWNADAGINFFQWKNETRTRWISGNLNANYSVAENRFRFSGRILQNFNRFNRLRLSLSFGNSASQFNDSDPISPLINTFSTLFFEKNYMKVYDLTYLKLSYGQELFNGLRFSINTGYEFRKALFNNTDYVIFPNDNVNYSSNNPVHPLDYNSAAIDDHSIIKTELSAIITFDQKYMSYPDGKFNLENEKYPNLRLSIENGLNASNNEFNFTAFEASIYQKITVANKGDLRYRLTGGSFLNGERISFVDYKHFNGNQTKVGTSSHYTNVFNLLPYYELSTNNSYFEGHIEHDFRGWILGKIPGINRLNLNMVFGAHTLLTEANKPYNEISVGLDNIGFGSFRLLRIDYVHSFYGDQKGAIIFGLKFLNLLN